MLRTKRVLLSKKPFNQNERERFLVVDRLTANSCAQVVVTITRNGLIDVYGYEINLS